MYSEIREQAKQAEVRRVMESETNRAMGALCGSSERQPEIIAALNSLESAVARYENIAAKLHSRLSAVTNPFNTPCEAIENASYQTDLGNRINAIRCQVRDITDGLENLLERIEL